MFRNEGCAVDAFFQYRGQGLQAVGNWSLLEAVRRHEILFVVLFHLRQFQILVHGFLQPLDEAGQLGFQLVVVLQQWPFAVFIGGAGIQQPEGEAEVLPRPGSPEAVRPRWRAPRT